MRGDGVGSLAYSIALDHGTRDAASAQFGSDSEQAVLIVRQRIAAALGAAHSRLLMKAPARTPQRVKK
jgi:hypothetical protein